MHSEQCLMTCSSTEAYTVAGTQSFLSARIFPWARLVPDCKLEEYACKGRELFADSDILLLLTGRLDVSPCSEGSSGRRSERERFRGAQLEPTVMTFPNPVNCTR
jgi:hypothetical protein